MGSSSSVMLLRLLDTSEELRLRVRADSRLEGVLVTLTEVFN